jgi:hypothetical protein
MMRRSFIQTQFCIEWVAVIKRRQFHCRVRIPAFNGFEVYSRKTVVPATGSNGFPRRRESTPSIDLANNVVITSIQKRRMRRCFCIKYQFCVVSILFGAE